jgi:DNA modification methylase
MTARFIVADVMDGLASLETGSVDLVVTSPPFLALRSYLPADHPDKSKEIGSEATPAEFIDVLLRVTQELRRVLASHGSICVELGDTYAGSGGAGGDYGENGWRQHQEAFGGSGRLARYADDRGNPDGMRDPSFSGANTLTGAGHGWPLAKSRALIPELYRIALAYGFNPLTGIESPAGKWRVRNNVTWCRPNPPVGALGDKWRPATSDLVVACVSDKRYWDDLATRKPHKYPDDSRHERPDFKLNGRAGDNEGFRNSAENSSGAPLLDYWEIPPTGYSGSHYAVFPPGLVEPCVKAMAPPKVCRKCGEPSRRIVESRSYDANGETVTGDWNANNYEPGQGYVGAQGAKTTQSGAAVGSEFRDLGWTDCGHDNYRPALILDPFAGSGTTGLVATGYGHDAVLIDIDERNAELAMERVGPFLMEIV